MEEKMKKLATITTIAVITIALGFAGVFAAEIIGKEMSVTGTQVFSASSLLGADVKNSKGENLGRINDLAVEPDGSVLFALVSRGFSGKLIPVPLSALTIKEKGKIVSLDITSEKLDTAPYFTGDKWPDMTNRKWSEDTHRFYGVQPYWQEKTMIQRESPEQIKKPLY